MPETVFPRWQGAFAAIFLLADGLYLPASPEAVRTLALGTVLSMLTAFLWMSMLRALGTRDLESLCAERLPQPLTRVLFAVLGAACLVGIVRSLVRLSAFWHTTAFSSLPRLLGAAILLFVGWRAGRRGRTAVAMWAYPMLFVTGAVILLSLLVTLPDCSVGELSAVFDRMTVSPSLVRQFVWFLLPLLLCTQDAGQPSARAAAVGALVGGAGLILIALRAWLVLGAGAVRLPYPAFSAAGVFSVGDFLQRGEVLFGCALALCEAVRVALLVTLLYQAGRIVFSQSKAKKELSQND